MFKLLEIEFVCCLKCVYSVKNCTLNMHFLLNIYTLHLIDLDIQGSSAYKLDRNN